MILSCSHASSYNCQRASLPQKSSLVAQNQTAPSGWHHVNPFVCACVCQRGRQTHKFYLEPFPLSRQKMRWIDFFKNPTSGNGRVMCDNLPTVHPPTHASCHTALPPTAHRKEHRCSLPRNFTAALWTRDSRD